PRQAGDCCSRRPCRPHHSRVPAAQQQPQPQKRLSVVGCVVKEPQDLTWFLQAKFKHCPASTHADSLQKHI
ncbi:unnamed protein product, partial [Gulo gulo]